MATNGLAIASPWASRIVLNILFVFITTNVNAGPNDNLKSKQFDKNLAIPEHGNDTSWLPDDFRLAPPNKESSKRRKRPKWKTGEIRDENGPEYVADEKSKWQKQMEKISPRESEKWKKYQTEKSKSLDTGKIHGSLIKNSDRRMRNGVIRKRRRNTRRQKSKAADTTNSENHGGYQSKVLKKPLGNRRVEKEERGEDFTPESEMENGRWKMRKNQEKDSRLLLEKSRRTWNVIKPKKKKSKILYHVINKIENVDKKEESPKLRMGELEKLETIEPGNNLQQTKNGRWGMSGGNEPPSEVWNEIFRMKAIENEGKIDKAKILWGKVDKRVLESPGESGGDIWKEKWEMSGRKEPGKFRAYTSRNEETEGTENVEKHLGLLKSGEEQTGEMRNFASYSSENEYWKKDDLKSSQGTIEHTRRTLNTQDLPNSLKNNEKFQGSNSPPGIRNLIQIIISPNNDAAIFLNGIELSMDQLFPGRKQSTSGTEPEPIVVELSTRVSDERR